MRFDLGTLDSGERSLPFGLLVSETIVVCDLKLATDDRSEKKFLLTSKFCPLGLYARPLSRGYIHVLNHEKKMYKIRLERDFFETCNKSVK